MVIIRFLIYFCYGSRFLEICFSAYCNKVTIISKNIVIILFYGCCQFLVNVEQNEKACHKYAGHTSTTFRYVCSSLYNENITFHFKYNFTNNKKDSFIRFCSYQKRQFENVKTIELRKYLVDSFMNGQKIFFRGIRYD